MIRRSFRIGLTLGVLGGLAWALVKMFGPTRRASSPASSEPTPWPTLVSDKPAPSPVVTPAPPQTAPPAPSGASVADPVPAQSVPATPGPAKSAEAKSAEAKSAPAKAKTKPKAPTKKKPAGPAWVEPKGNACPTTHPVKGKLTSKIFHPPGMLNYARTHPDRCYRDAAAAEADGLRAAKR